MAPTSASRMVELIEILWDELVNLTARRVEVKSRIRWVKPHQQSFLPESNDLHGLCEFPRRFLQVLGELEILCVSQTYAFLRGSWHCLFIVVLAPTG